MAARNIVNPKVINQLSTKNTVSQTSIDLDEETKRWAVVGIAMANVLSPALQKYIDQKLYVLYNELVKNYKVNTDQNTLKDPGKEGYWFQYRNYTKHNIKSHHDLATLFLDKKMVKFKKNHR